VKKKWRVWLRRAFRIRPVVRQYEQTDCGPAALLTVLRFWGGRASLGYVRNAAGTNQMGSTLLGLKEAAEALGFEAVGVKGTLEELKEQSLPCIAHFFTKGEPPHFVVVYAIKKRHVVVGDPAVGIVKMKFEQFVSRWSTGVALLLVPTESIAMGRGTPWYRWVVAAIRPHAVRLLLASMMALVYTTLGLSVAWLVRALIDGWIPNGAGVKVAVFGGLLFVAMLLRAAVGFFRHRILLDLNMKVGSAIGNRLFGRLFKLPVQFFELRRIGDITARLQDGIKVGDLAIRVGGAIISDCIVLVGTILALAVVAPPIALFAVTAMSLTFFLGAFFRNGLRLRQHAVLTAFGRLESQFVESLTANEVIRRAVVGGHTAGRLERANRLLQKDLAGLGRFESLASAGVEGVAGFAVAATLSFGGMAVINGIMTLGQLLAGYSLVAGVTPVAGRLLDSFLAVQGAQVSANRVADIIETATEGQEVQASEIRIVDQLEFRNVIFGWPNREPVLKGVNLDLVRGFVTGLCGVNGAGKSTIVKLLTREYRPNGGAVVVRGEDVQNFSLERYRRQIGVVTAQTPIFRGTVFENVSLGRSEITARCVERWAGWLGLGDVLARLPRKLDTVVGPAGRWLSVGEAQIIGFLRAVVTSPGVLVLDEAFAGVDDALCNSIFRGIKKRFKGGAVLLISHRKDILVGADRTFVLAGGVLHRRDECAGLEIGRFSSSTA